MSDPVRASHRLRLSQADAHYGGNLVAGGRLMELFGDVATELCIRSDGDEGLFAGYSSVDFLAPLHAGDFIQVEGEVAKKVARRDLWNSGFSGTLVRDQTSPTRRRMSSKSRSWWLERRVRAWSNRIGSARSGRGVVHEKSGWDPSSHLRLLGNVVEGP